MRILAIVFSVSILLSACSGAASKQEGLIVMDESNTKVYPQMDMLIDLVDEWEVIPLENSEQAFLHSSSNIEGDGQIQAFEFKWNSSAKYKFPKQFFENYPDSTFMLIHRDNVEDFLL